MQDETNWEADLRLEQCDFIECRAGKGDLQGCALD